MTLTIIILLVLAGTMLILLDIFVLAGSMVVGLIGIVMLICAVWGAYSSFGVTSGNYVLMGTLVIFAGFIYYSFKPSTWKKAMLHESISGKVNTFDPESVKLGSEGKAVSRICPSGKALINGQYYEVHSIAELIDEGKAITVIKTESNKIYVKSTMER